MVIIYVSSFALHQKVEKLVFVSQASDEDQSLKRQQLQFLSFLTLLDL